MKYIEIEEDKYKKLVKVFNKYYEFQNIKKLSKQEIRQLQYLIKTTMPEEKVKLYGLINIYKNSDDVHLNNYVYNLFFKLKGISNE